MGDDQPVVTTGTRTPAWRAHPKGGGRLEADLPSRVWALLIDLVLCLVVGFVAACAALLATTLFRQSRELGHGVRFSMVGWTTSPDVPTWVTTLILVGLVVTVLGLSGALSRAGRRRSMGLAMAELRLVRWPIAGQASPDPFDPGVLEPARWRVALRWLVPVATFLVLAEVLVVYVAGLLVLVAWLPALVGRRRSLYDLITGTAVVDGERLVGFVSDAGREDAVA